MLAKRVSHFRALSWPEIRDFYRSNRCLRELGVNLATRNSIRNPFAELSKGMVQKKRLKRRCSLAHQNRTIAISSDFRVDGAKNRQKSRRKKGFWDRRSQLKIANR